MKIEELKKAIRHLVRQEVKKIVAEEVSKAMGKVLVEMVKEIKSNNPSPIVEEVEEIPSRAAVLQTKNPKLNAVLAETARHFKPLQNTPDMSVGLTDLMEGGFDKIGRGESAGVEAPATKIDFLKQMVGSPLMESSQPSALDGGAEVPDALKKVFKKDFRAIMKRIDEQKKNGSGGYIDATRLLTG
jgi:hypothetical protein